MRQKSEDAPDEPRFHIVQSLGRGGFGDVHEAIDRHTGQRVALKQLTHLSPSALFRFKQEFRALADIHHPNVVSLRELMEQDGRWYIVMELVEGQHLLEFLRVADNDPAFDEQRLRQAFVGIAQGLEALHAHGILHRDLKPSNVRVTREGRAMLLDFGLVTSVDTHAQSTHAGGVGTVWYMAPEQVDAHKLGRPADWYAFGVCLYEALTGRLPFDGDSAIRIALDKQRLTPAHPSTVVSGLPADLAALCMQLLQISPERRPAGRDTLRVLEGGHVEAAPAPTPASPSFAPPLAFAGREAELEYLNHALDLTHEGAFRIVLVEGESGVGKSELVAEFLRRRQLRDPRTMALRGRCYENEQVSYKAFDGCIDELARTLKRMGDDARPLMPLNAALLAQLFPVLGDVQAIHRAQGGNFAADPTARRLQAFAALSALLGNLAEERPLILVVDDLQWADAESFRMLRALFEDRERPPILVLCTVRPREELESDTLRALDLVREWKCTGVIPILGLPRPQAEELATMLLGPGADPKWAGTIATESRGHPLFLSELIHFTRSREAGATGALTLEAALRARIERLPRQARALLELVGIAARPHAAEIFARALEVPKVDEAVTALLAAKLLRRRRDQLGCFHDRIRRVVVSLIAGTRLKNLHKQLARALAQDLKSDPAEQAGHWDLAGEVDQAVQAYEGAAQQALASLAFARAERLYARALDLLGRQEQRDERYTRFTTERAHAVACAGRSAEAAALYQRAAELASGDERLRLRSRNAQHLMLSAQPEAGLAACRALLGELGVSLPRSLLGMLLRTAWDRLWITFAGRNVGRPRRIRERGDSRASLVLDLLYELSGAVANVDTNGYQALITQYLRKALRQGDAFHIASAYADEGYLRSMRGHPRQALAFFESSKRLSNTLAKPAMTARLCLFEGAALNTSYEHMKTVAHLEQAESLYQAHCADEPWSLTKVRFRLGIAWAQGGEHAHLARKMDAWIGEAHERQDHFAVALLSGLGYGSQRHLMRGDPGQALAELDDAFAKLPAAPFASVHLGQLIGTQRALLVRGGRAALDWFDTRRKQHDRARLLKLRFGKEVLMMLRAGAALGACDVASPSERKGLLRSVHKQASWLARREPLLAKGLGALYAAQVAALEGATERAIALARTAQSTFGAMRHTWAHDAAYLEGLLEGGDAGREKCAAVLALYRSQEWMEPRRELLTSLPALRVLERPSATTKSRHAQLIHHYEVIGPLGSGAFGTVVEARDTKNARTVALKELVSTSARSLERFKQEFRALQDLHHPNLVRFDALFEYEGRWYIAMELVRGVDLLSYVRPGGELEPTRLLQAFEGLLAGVHALHEAGFIHRDITPDNVCITAEGRAVLLDFGLIAREHDARDAGGLGSADYAPPEQLEGSPPDASADVYALGSCLYQALSSQLPFAAPDAVSLAAFKRTRRPRPLSVPALRSLANACLLMLEADPRERPSLAELVDLMAIPGVSSKPSHRPTLALVPDQAMAASFAGRQAELEQLLAAAARAQTEFGLTLIEGESGLGKSALAAEFASLLEAQRPGLMVLSGRCYENELLALKAFDGVVDQLARVLRVMPPEQCEALLPRKAALLAQLFPVLGTLPAIAKASKKGLPADPGARRVLGLSCFVELLERLGRSQPVLLVIDDLQWADVESLRLLRTLSARGAALPLLVVATLRPRSELAPELASDLEALGQLPSTRTVSLGQLSPQDAEVLATSLLGNTAGPALIKRIVQECKGHPLFLRELVEHAKAGGASPDSSIVSLDEALRTRMDRFDAETSKLIALVALAGKPHPSRVFAAALGRAELLHESLNELLNRGLLRRRGQDGLTCYHDRIRHTALARLSAAERRELTRRLAAALHATSDSDPAERARLWDQAGQAEQAIGAFEEAGDAALAKLAFVEAEQHYARALALMGEARDERFRTLTIQRAHALVRMGKNAEAAHFFGAAAEGAEGELRANLRVWAAQNLIRGAQVKEGLAAASKLLGELGVPMPKSQDEALRRIVWEGVRLKVRGIAFKPGAGHTDPTKRLALAALNELGQPVASVLFLEGSALSAQHLRRALDGGDPAHAARALAYEAFLRCTRNPQADHSALFARARELAESTRDPAVIAAVELRHGSACISLWDFSRARDSLSAAHDRVLSQCPDHPWLLTASRMYLGHALDGLGEYGALSVCSEEWIREARERGDRHAYAAVASFGMSFMRHLMRNDPAAASAEIEEAMAPWPDIPFSTNHYGALLVRVRSRLWNGGDSALHWFEQHRERLEASFLAKAPGIATVVCLLRAAACFSAMDSLVGQQNEQLLKAARLELGVLRKLRAPGSDAHARLLNGALLAVSGQRELALGELRASNLAFVRTQYCLRHLVTFLEGWIEGGETGRAKCDGTLAGLHAQGFVDPMRYISALLPVFHLLPSS